MLVFTAVCCTGAAIYGWRLRCEKQLVRLVNQFNLEMDKRDYEAALITAEVAERQFPAEPCAVFMLQKAQLVRSLSRGENLPMLQCP